MLYEHIRRAIWTYRDRAVNGADATAIRDVESSGVHNQPIEDVAIVEAQACFDVAQTVAGRRPREGHALN